MSWANIGAAATSVNSKTSSATLAMPLGATVQVGNYCVVSTAWNNFDTTDSETSQLSIADDAGGGAAANVWVKLVEYTTGSPGANAGVVFAFFGCLVTTELTTAHTITITSVAARVAKSAGAHEFGINGNSVAVAGKAVLSNLAVDPGDITVSGLANLEYLWLYGIGAEGPSTDAYTHDADYSNMNASGTTGGADDSNIQHVARRRIFTGTADTVVTASTTADRDYAQVLVALAEFTHPHQWASRPADLAHVRL